MPWKKLCLLVTLLIAPAAKADIIIYTNQSAFQTALASYYLQTFEGSTANGPAVTLAGNGYSFTASGQSFVGVLSVSGTNALTVNLPNESLNFGTFGGSPNAFGANFFFDDGANGLSTDSSGLIQVSNGIDPDVFQAVTAPANLSTFFGFISTLGPVTSITFSKTAGAGYVNVDNAVVGTAIPEPSCVALLGLGLAALAVYQRQR